MYKFCPQCNLEKEETEYSKSQFKIKSGWCKLCNRLYNKQYRLDHNYDERYYKENKSKKKEYSKAYRINNSEDVSIYNKAYYQNNKSRLNITHTEYVGNRRKNDMVFKLRDNISKNINRSIKRNGSSKNGKSILMFLPYSIQELKVHLECQFEYWMTWENWGRYNSKTWNDKDYSTWTWQIDHIIPKSKFEYISMTDEAFQKCWALANLRPLNAKQNIIDNKFRKE